MNTIEITYTGEHPCSTRTPDADWEPGETKNIDVEMVDHLLTNTLFKRAEGGAEQ